MLSERTHGSLPNTSKVNPKREGKKQSNTITLRSGKEIEEPKRGVANAKDKEEMVEEKKAENSIKGSVKLD